MVKTQLAIIGTGRHIEKNVLPALKDCEKVNLVGMFGNSPDRTTQLAKTADCQEFRSLQEALNQPHVTTVYVANPVGLHAEAIEQALLAGKNVWCEKSLTDNLGDWQRLYALAQSRNLALFECFMFCYHPQAKAVKHMVATNMIGQTQSLEIEFTIPHLSFDNFRYQKNLGGGALFDVGCYTLKSVEFLFDDQNLRIIQSQVITEPQWEVDILGTAKIQIPGNGTAHLKWGFGQPYENEIFIQGSTGSLKTDRIFSKPSDLITTIHVKKQETENVVIPAANHFTIMFDDFSVKQSSPKDKVNKMNEDLRHAMNLFNIFSRESKS